MESITIEAKYDPRVDMWVAVYPPLGIATAAETIAALVEEIDRLLAESAERGKWRTASPRRITLRTIRGNETSEESIEVGLTGSSVLAQDARWARSNRHFAASLRRTSARMAFMGWFMLVSTAAMILIRVLRMS